METLTTILIIIAVLIAVLIILFFIFILWALSLGFRNKFGPEEVSLKLGIPWLINRNLQIHSNYFIYDLEEEETNQLIEIIKRLIDNP